MKTNLAIALLAVGLFTAVGVAEAADPMANQSSDEAMASASSLVIGHIAKIDGNLLLVQEDGGAPVQVQITPETVSPPNLKVGDQVMVSLLAGGVAAVITSGQIEAEMSVLDETGRDAR